MRVLLPILLFLATPSLAQEAPAAAPAEAATPTNKDALKYRSGLPVPRFASLRAGRAYMRAGPGKEYPVTWVFVRPGIPEFMRDRAVPASDIITPNQFELEWLTGRAVGTLAEAKAAVRALQESGPRCVLVTSLRVEDTPADAIEMLAAEGGQFWRVRTPLLPISVNGAGDAIAALFLFHRLRWGDVRVAVSSAASSIHGLLRRTAEAGSREILTVAAQDEFVRPSQTFVAEPC